MKELRAKIWEALLSALPITAVVYLMALTPWFDMNRAELITFTVGAVLLILGIGLFNLGADLAMTPMGTHVGSGLSKQGKLLLLLAVCFVLGMLITIAEPDLQVLAAQVSAVMNGTMLVYAVGIGVGSFLVIAVLRIVFHRRLSNILMLFYMLLFALALLLAVNEKTSLLPMAFDSGGVTTGPITVPFIMALGVGVAGVLGDKHSKENSFGLVSLCSIGPILAVMVLGMFSGKNLTYQVPDYTVSPDVLGSFLHALGHTAKEVALALGLMLAVNGNLPLLPMSFDSGGVTTGPITVPFIMALGVGISGVLGDPRSKDNSFGLVALCSVGPVLAVLVLGIFASNNLTYAVPDYTVSGDILGSYLHTAAHTCKEVALALGLIVVFFLVCQVLFLKLSFKRLKRIAVGVSLTYIGLVLFLTGVNVGFMPIGYKLGHALASADSNLLILFGLVTGVLVVLAEPAIHVLNGQVEEVTGGMVSKRAMMIGLCVGVGAAITLSMVRIVYDFSLVYYIIPGYFISLALSLFVPPVYTAIAFDSGGVASGPMTSGFILPFAVGACVALQGGEAVLRDAFGVVALVAMIPLITIQLLGFKGLIDAHVQERKAMKRILDADEQQIINFM